MSHYLALGSCAVSFWLGFFSWQYSSWIFFQWCKIYLTTSTHMSLQHCDWSAGTLARAASTCCKWLQQSEKSTLSPVSPTIITASLLSYYSPTLAHLHWLPHILVDAYLIWCLMLFSSAYFILEVAKTTSLYLGQAIIRADVPFDFYLDNTLRMLSESVNTSRLLVWLLSFESFVLVAFWKTGCCGARTCLCKSVSVTVNCLFQLCMYESSWLSCFVF